MRFVFIAACLFNPRRTCAEGLTAPLADAVFGREQSNSTDGNLPALAPASPAHNFRVWRLLHMSKIDEFLAYGPEVRDDTINVFAMSVVATAVGRLITEELQPGQRLLRVAPQIPGSFTERAINKILKKKKSPVDAFLILLSSL